MRGYFELVQHLGQLLIEFTETEKTKNSDQKKYKTKKPRIYCSVSAAAASSAATVE